MTSDQRWDRLAVRPSTAAPEVSR
ncbi:hypothetical protein SMALA_8487 [Streptomyces malaysiensis subsp. malaysiensis]|nr:hypothetical protein SMALA_8487 [Streptomyces malaysiensis]